MKQRPVKAYAFWIALSELTGAVSGRITRKGMKVYTEQAVKPPLTPPPAVFPVAWGILYALMGVGAALVFLARPGRDRSLGLGLFLAQLGVNFVWSLIFFGVHAYGFALVWLAALLALALLMTLRFLHVSRAAGLLQIPYLLWLCFAFYLNLGVWRLNG